jgi:hypothetical protein
MRSRSRCRTGIARPLFVALLPIAFWTPASAQPVPGLPFGNGGNSYYAVSPGRNAVGSAYGDGGAETPWQRRSPQYETHRGGPGYGGRLNWLPGATGVAGILPMLGGGASWPSAEQVPARSESAPSAPGYQAYPGSATPQTQPGRPWSEPSPSGPNWQTQPRPEPSGEPLVTAPNYSASSSARTIHQPSSHPPSGKVAGRSHPMIYPPRKPPVPPPQQIQPPSNPLPAVTVAAIAVDAPRAAPSAAAPPPEPPPPAITAPATPPSPSPAPPTQAPTAQAPTTQAASAQSPAKPVWSVAQIGLPLSALVALALLVFPLRLLTRAWRRRSRRHVARVVLVGDPGASQMIPAQAGTDYLAITLRLSAARPVATPRWTAA